MPASIAGKCATLLGRLAEDDRIADARPRHALDAHTIYCQQNEARVLIYYCERERSRERAQEAAPLFRVRGVQSSRRIVRGFVMLAAGMDGLAADGDRDALGRMNEWAEYQASRGLLMRGRRLRRSVRRAP